MPKYKFDEDHIIDNLREYVDKTYSQHYANNNPEEIQTFELIAKNPLRGFYFCTSNIIKYADRAGLKEDDIKKELLKIMHYAIMATNCVNKNEIKIETVE